MDIILYITDFLDWLSQMNFTAVNKTFHDIKITNLYVSDSIASKLTENYLNKHLDITKLNLYSNFAVNRISNFKCIRILNISNCGISDIKGMDLLELNISNNKNFFDLSVFKNLRVLKIDGICNINLDDLKLLDKLEIIYARINPRAAQIKNIVNVEVVTQWN